MRFAVFGAVVLQASDYDRYYGILGLKPGGSLPEIEASWKRRFADAHPDKAAAGSRERATSRAQEINNARDELRRYWRTYGKAPPSLTGERPRVTSVHIPEAEPAPAAPSAAAPTPPRSAGSRRADDRPAAPRRRILAYSTAAAVGLVAAVGLGLQGMSGRIDSPPLAAPADAAKPAPRQPAADNGLRAADTAAAAMPAPVGALPPRPSTAPTREPAPGTVFAAPVASAPVAPVTTDAPTSLPEAASPIAAEPAAPTVPVLPPAPPAASAGGPPASPVSPPASPAVSTAKPPRAHARHSAEAAAAPPLRQPHMSDPTRPRQSPYDQSLRSAAIKACSGDLRIYCGAVQVGGGRIAECAREHFRQFSPRCSDALLAIRAAREAGGVAAPRY